MNMRTHDAAPPASRPRRWGWPLPAAAALLVAGTAGWLVSRHDTGTTPAPQPAAAVAPAASAAASAAPVAGLPPPRPPLPPEETPAQLLHKVQQGLDGNSSPHEALQAAKALSLCAALAGVSEKLAEAGLQGPGRGCQLFDAATLARRGALYRRAYEGDPLRAADAYLRYLTVESPQDQPDPQLLAALRADVRKVAESGDIAGLTAWAYGDDTWAQKMGFGLVEARGYREAYYRILDESIPGGSAGTRALTGKLAQMAQLGPAPAVLTAEQQREVDALAQRVLEAWRQRWRRPGGG